MRALGVLRPLGFGLGIDYSIAGNDPAYLSVGSHNMDYRGLMMDGEVLYVTASRGVLPGMLDLLILLGLSDWVEDAHQLDALLPPYKEWQREVGRFMKYAL